MRWIAILACFFVLTGAALAAGSDEQYLDVYNEILQGDALLQGGRPDAAAVQYQQAQTDLLKLHADHPSWNPDIVNFRLQYLADQLKSLGKTPATNAPPVTATNAPSPAAVPAPVSVGPTVADLEHENAALRDQVRSLTDANAELQAKLKEALSVQPAAVSPAELDKANAKILALQKERDLLSVALEQEKAANANSVSAAKFETLINQLTVARAAAEADAKKSREKLAQLTEVLTQAEEKLATANSQLDALKAAHPPEIQPAAPTQIPEAADQLKAQLADISKDEAEISALKDEVTAANQKLAVANTELDSLKAARPAATEPTDDLKAVTAERDKLKEELADRSKDLADAEAHNNQELLNLRGALQQAEQQRDDLEKKLAAASPATTTSARQVEQLEARVAVLEANPVPYTPEELAALQNTPAPAPQAAPAPSSPAPAAPTTAPTAPPVAAAVPVTAPTNAASATEAPAPHVYSSQDLPPGVGPLWADAMRASMEHDYDTAESKFNEVLRQDETNVYVLDHLGEAQFAANHLDACEKTVQKAISIDGDDPASQYLLGLLRYRQDRLDEALDALSLSAKLNATNSATQNFLGCVLAEKGFRPAAETAFRKSLESDPDNADAHFNLAVVYAGDHPPSVELARWHYKKALALGHQRSATLDKLLTPGQ